MVLENLSAGAAGWPAALVIDPAAHSAGTTLFYRVGAQRKILRRKIVRFELCGHTVRAEFFGFGDDTERPDAELLHFVELCVDNITGAEVIPYPVVYRSTGDRLYAQGTLQYE